MPLSDDQATSEPVRSIKSPLLSSLSNLGKPVVVTATVTATGVNTVLTLQQDLTCFESIDLRGDGQAGRDVEAEASWVVDSKGRKLALGVWTEGKLDPRDAPKFKLAKSKFKKNEKIVVTFDRALVAPAGQQYWITIIDPSEPDTAYGDWHYVPAKAKKDTLVATKPGTYEIRLNDLYPRFSGKVLSREGARASRAGSRAQQRENEIKESQAKAQKRIADERGIAEQARIRIDMESKNELVRAEAAAQAQLIRAEAEAKAIALRSNALTTDFLSFETINTWNGQLPQ